MAFGMSDPVIVARADHPISRSSIDPDALKVLTRLHDADHTAYLVGGSVRDLLLGRRPKDFDVGTSAHPYQIKKLFRNCWIIGRRFRLAHVKFGDKAIEVATFRQHVPAVPAEPQVDETELERDGAGEPVRDVESRDLQIHRDNTFGTPEEDAFRRDFTVNALFYNIADRSIIDYVGGLGDIRDRVIRSIGDPNERFQEDPVRMLRAVVLAARLDFSLDPPVEAAIEAQRHRLALASPARLIEEYYKVLRSGAAERTFQDLARYRLLEPITPELQERAADEGFLDALDALDSFRQRFESAPATLTNPILLGTLVVPLGLMPTRERPEPDDADHADAEDDAVLAAGAGRPSSPPHRAARAGVQDRPADRRAPRHRPAAAAAGGAAPPAGHGGLAARQAGAAASRAVRGRVDLARGPRPGTRDRGALAGLHRGQLVAGRTWQRLARRGHRPAPSPAAAWRPAPRRTPLRRPAGRLTPEQRLAARADAPASTR